MLRTPLHAGSYEGDSCIVNDVLATGADVDIALKYRRLEVIEILQQAIKDQNSIKEPDC